MELENTEDVLLLDDGLYVGLATNKDTQQKSVGVLFKEGTHFHELILNPEEASSLIENLQLRLKELNEHSSH